MLIFVALACAVAAPPASSAPAAPAAPTVSAPAPSPVAASTTRTAQTGKEALGINEAVSIPKLFIEQARVAPAQESALLASDAAAAVGLGAGIVRGNTAVYPYLDMDSLQKAGWDFTRADRWVGAVQAAGLDALVMVGPWPGNATAAYTTVYVPADLPAYEAYLRRVVERYDGDGVDDMPGLLRPIRYWEVDNEPDLHNWRPPRNGPQRIDPALFERPDEYAAVLIASGRAIHAADPLAKVLTAGFFRPHSPPGAAYVEAVFDDPAAVAAVDIFSAHCYIEEDGVAAIGRAIALSNRVLPGKPIWFTETSVPSDNRKPHITEDWQAAMVVRIIGAALAGGADRVFWHTLADPPWAREHRSAPFSSNSLLRSRPPTGADPQGDGFDDKPAGAVYRRLAALLGPTQTADYRPAPAVGGALLWTGAGWLAYEGEPALPPGAGPITDLRTGATVTRTTAPAWIAAAKIGL